MLKIIKTAIFSAAIAMGLTAVSVLSVQQAQQTKEVLPAPLPSQIFTG